jgi:hypothetical protein
LYGTAEAVPLQSQDFFWKVFRSLGIFFGEDGFEDVGLDVAAAHDDDDFAEGEQFFAVEEDAGG